MIQKQNKYWQAKLAILDLIAQNELNLGDKLPPERQLVEMLNCSSITMRAALRDLEERGVIEKRHGQGNFLTREIQKSPCSGEILFLNILTADEFGQLHVPTDPANNMVNFLRERGLKLKYLEITGLSQEVFAAAGESAGIVVHNRVTPELVRDLKILNLPVMSIGNNPCASLLPHVRLATENAAYNLTKKLLTSNPRRIGFLNGERTYDVARDSIRGFKRAMEEAHRQYDEQSEVCWVRYANAPDDIERFLSGNEFDAILVESGSYIPLLTLFWEGRLRQKPLLGITPVLTTDLDWQCRHLFRPLPGVHIAAFPESVYIEGLRIFVNHLASGAPLISREIEAVIQ